MKQKKLTYFFKKKSKWHKNCQKDKKKIEAKDPFYKPQSKTVQKKEKEKQIKILLLEDFFVLKQEINKTSAHVLFKC